MPTSKKKRENDTTTSKIWVYSNTNIPYTENFNITDLKNIVTDKKSGSIKKGDLQKPDGTTFQVELISKNLQKLREGVWVYTNTGIPFPENINLANLTNTTTNKKNGFITQGTLQKSDGTTHQVELITKAAQKLREGIWVYAGTVIPFPENINLANLTNTSTDKKSGFITQGTLQKSDGTTHQVEFITKSAQKQRERIWVYANTGIPYPENVNIENLSGTTMDNKSGYIQGDFQKPNGMSDRIEFITKDAQKQREGIWVYAGTSLPFPENINLANLTNTTTDKKSGFITQGTLQKSDGTTHQVEFITKAAQQQRKGIWVYANTSIPFPENINLSNLTNTTTDKKSGWITQGTLQRSNGTIANVEFISKKVQRDRERIWVYAGTGISFPENVNPSNLANTSTDKKSGRITKGTLQTSDGATHQVEFITKAAQIMRSKRQPEQTPADVSTNTIWVPSLFQSLVTDPSNQLEKDEQNKPHKRVKR